ncbi:Las1-domain-containing protein [Thelephora ganbajun]|uniref:Las1-domain-containing protein n=1 Tax=Thelephora ganbajun TaxID=370292 RepID=A0ACB6ZM73_THEGA|nr:Las1-domain-containing protein [Thelephora ganbajun]
MQLPRRVPWASLSELEQLCTWIYSDETDLRSKQLAVNKLSAWKSTTQLSHALESTLGLLTVTLQDDLASQPPSSAALSGYNLRQCYSTATIRLVNGLVDPLQSGVYARSIASIAAQLGLPGWLVEVRHAATHEELPPLEVLREAAHESLKWLFHNYFMPELHPSSQPNRRQPLRSAAPLLKEYSVLMKIVTRDTSLRQKHQPEIHGVLRDIERWIAEAKTAVDISSGNLGWEGIELDDSTVSSTWVTKERLALEALCDNLMEKGALVPLARKKRTLDAKSFHPQRETISLWMPLIHHIESLHAGFITVLIAQLTLQLLNEPSAPGPVTPPARDGSYESFIGAWVVYLLDTQTLPVGDEGADQELTSRTKIIPIIMGGLGPPGVSTFSERKT